MDLGQSHGGLPPDNVVEDIDGIMAATEAAIDTHHDPSPGSMVRIGVAPCSPFTVTEELLTQAAALARRKGVRLHTHLAETMDEDVYCREHFGGSPVDYMDGLGWLGPDVWLAHAVHLDDAALAKVAATGTGVAHCPSSNARLGSGIARANPVLGSERVLSIARRLGVTPAQIALAWTLDLAPCTLLIPGTSSVRHLEENLACAGTVLDEDARKQLAGESFGSPA